MGKALARRQEVTSWQQVTQLPDGPVGLWMAILSTGGALMGAAPITGLPVWVWHNGMLAVDYGPVKVWVDQPGWYETGCIIAVSGRRWMPVIRISLGKPGELRRGDDITIIGGKIAWTSLTGDISLGSG